MEDTNQLTPEPRRGVGRIVTGFAVALALAAASYAVVQVDPRFSAGVASIWFFCVAPACFSALICYIGDPDGVRPTSFY